MNIFSALKSGKNIAEKGLKLVKYAKNVSKYAEIVQVIMSHVQSADIEVRKIWNNDLNNNGIIAKEKEKEDE